MPSAFYDLDFNSQPFCSPIRSGHGVQSTLNGRMLILGGGVAGGLLGGGLPRIPSAFCRKSSKDSQCLCPIFESDTRQSKDSEVDSRWVLSAKPAVPLALWWPRVTPSNA